MDIQDVLHKIEGPVGGVVTFVGLAIGRQLYARVLERHIDNILAKILGSRSLSRKNLTGIWQSVYSYPDRFSGTRREASHFIVIRQIGNKLKINSLPHSIGSVLTMNLVLDGGFCGGEWREVTSKSAIYHGSVQFMVSADRKAMKGRWLGFSATGSKINQGEWQLYFRTADLSRRSRRSEKFRL